MNKPLKTQYHFLEVDENNRPTHLHQLNVDGVWKNLTGTSGIGDVLYKPLEWWASGKAVEYLGWSHSKVKKNGKIIGEVLLETRLKKSTPILKEIKKDTPEKYLERLDNAYKNHSVFAKDAAGKGTDLHWELEKFVKTQMGIMKEKKFHLRIQPFIDWSKENVKRFLWSEAHCFHEDLWIGGITDAGVELKDGSYSIIDFKSSKDAFTTQFIQCAGYVLQIEKNGLWDKFGKKNKKLNKPIASLMIVPFGAEVVTPVARFNIEDYKTAFQYAVFLYRLLGLDKK